MEYGVAKLLCLATKAVMPNTSDPVVGVIDGNTTVQLSAMPPAEDWSISQ
jgi:hypothetical protein